MQTKICECDALCVYLYAVICAKMCTGKTYNVCIERLNCVLIWKCVYLFLFFLVVWLFLFHIRFCAFITREYILAALAFETGVLPFCFLDFFDFFMDLLSYVPTLTRALILSPNSFHYHFFGVSGCWFYCFFLRIYCTFRNFTVSYKFHCYFFNFILAV